MTHVGHPAPGWGAPSKISSEPRCSAGRRVLTPLGRDSRRFNQMEHSIRTKVVPHGGSTKSACHKLTASGDCNDSTCKSTPSEPPRKRSTCKCTKRPSQKKIAEFLPKSTTCRSCFPQIGPPASARILRAAALPPNRPLVGVLFLDQPPACRSTIASPSLHLQVYRTAPDFGYPRWYLSRQLTHQN